LQPSQQSRRSTPVEEVAAVEVDVPAVEVVVHRVAVPAEEVAGAAPEAEVPVVEEEQAGVAERAAPPVAVPVEGVDQPAVAEFVVEGRQLPRTMRPSILPKLSFRRFLTFPRISSFSTSWQRARADSSS